MHLNLIAKPRGGEQVTESSPTENVDTPWWENVLWTERRDALW